MPVEGLDDALGASYRLIGLIGRGATGEVWRGVDRRTDESIAAKLLRVEHVHDDDLVERFLRERSILVGLRNPNVVAVRDLVVEGDRLAIVMDFVDGGSLRDALRESGPLRPGLALGVVAQVLDGLAAAHERRVLHRDLKPDNVLLSTGWRDLAPGAVKLSDFGISRIVAERQSTSTGLVGTPEYMAPEQLVTGAGDLPADVYGVGILLYELLAGRTPFAGSGTGYTIAYRHVSSLPPRLPLPDPLWDAVALLLDKDPRRRPGAATAAVRLRALRSDVADLSALPVQGTPDTLVSAGGPATEVRGLVVPTTAPRRQAADEVSDVPLEPLPDLGTPGQQTMLRSMPTVPEPTPRSSGPSEAEAPARRRWREPRTIALVAAGALLVAGGVFWLVSAGGTPGPSTPTTAPEPVRAQQQSSVRPTGLTISRVATWDASTQTVALAITYTAQRAPLQGPFLEVVPGVADAPGCPATTWEDEVAKLNLPSGTGIDTACAWSVAAPPVPAQQSVTVTATVPLTLPGNDPASALDTWLQAAAQATETATSDGDVTSTAYAAQRLTDIEVVAPARAVSGQTLTISLIPVWPSGADELNPMFRSPPTGRPSSILLATAGGNGGVRFSDGCSGALSVSGDGLVVSAQSVATSCQVDARVGNFTDLASNDFAVVTRGS